MLYVTLTFYFCQGRYALHPGVFHVKWMSFSETVIRHSKNPTHQGGEKMIQLGLQTLKDNISTPFN